MPITCPRSKSVRDHALTGVWPGEKYIADGVADRIINFYYLIELKGESRRELARKQVKEAPGS